MGSRRGETPSKMRVDYIVHGSSASGAAAPRRDLSYAQHASDPSSTSPGAPPRPPPTERPANGSNVRCEYCGLRYSHRGNLSKHIKTAHRNHRPHKCEICKLSFHYPDGLRRHQNLCHNESSGEKRPFKCNTCGATFKHRSNLSKHMNAAHKK